MDHGAFETLFGEPVTTSATGKPQRMSDVPVNMEIITADQIRRSGADNLPDILRFVPGLDVRRYGFAAADVGVRGYARPFNPRLLVLVNGQQVYLDDYGRTQWYALPVELDEIRQIEVVKGPNTALFGFNAASGIINIVTWNPLKDRINTATVRGGTQDYAALSAVGTAQVSDWGGVRVSAGGFRARDFEQAGTAPGQPARLSPRRGSVAVDARTRPAPGVEVTLSGSLVSLRTSEEASSPYSANSFYDTNSVRAAVSAETRAGLLEVNLYRNGSRYNYLTPLGPSDLSDAVYVAQASDTVKIGADHTIRAGLEYRNNTATTSRDSNGHFGYEVVSGSLMWDWQVAPSVTVTNAVRLDRLTLNQSGPLLAGTGLAARDFRGRSLLEPSFNSGVVWHATDQDTVRLTAARGLQLPSLFNFSFQASGSADLGFGGRIPVYFTGSPTLQASAVSNLELSYDRALPGLRSTVRAAVFAQRTDGVITDSFGTIPVFDGRSLHFTAANTGHSSAVGGEVGLRGGMPAGVGISLRWEASYAYISVSDHLAVLASAVQDFQHGTPTHVVTLGGGYSIGRLELDAQARWQSRYRDYRGDPVTFALTPVEVGNYVTLNARAGYKVTDGLTLALTGQQLNRSRLLQSAGPPVERRLFLSATVRF